MAEATLERGLADALPQPADERVPAKALAGRDSESCPACGRQLAAIGGVLVRGLKPNEITTRDPDGRIRAADLEPELDAEGRPTGRPSDRAKRGVYIGCGSCRQPVPQDHPKQRALDRQWVESERREQAEAARAGTRPPPAMPYRELNPVTCLEERCDVLERELAATRKLLAQLTARLERAETQLATRAAARRPG